MYVHSRILIQLTFTQGQWSLLPESSFFFKKNSKWQMLRLRIKRRKQFTEPGYTLKGEEGKDKNYAKQQKHHRGSTDYNESESSKKNS